MTAEDLIKRVQYHLIRDEWGQLDVMDVALLTLLHGDLTDAGQRVDGADVCGSGSELAYMCTRPQGHPTNAADVHIACYPASWEHEPREGLHFCWVWPVGATDGAT